jgi:hypothetical protein
MFIRYTPEDEIARLTAEFHESKQRIWEDDSLRLEEKGPAIDQLWKAFDEQRKALRSAAPEEEEATGQEAASPRRSFLPRRRRRLWK